uniref:Chlorocatechol 1,2-dioxygenase n=3 Tax=Comamonadaceae TaxID=80864 RepID=O87481_DELAC|nr:chlorocatechol 1,2-dioxygenase [Delftia acidovorans]ADM86744.1 chlorocatechol 1,2-dioxygenase [Delftia acidovorans]
MNERVKQVASALVDAIQKTLTEQRVTEEEWRAGVGYMMKLAEAKEMDLLLDVFFNHTIVDLKAQATRGSTPAIQGPYFLEGAPVVAGALKTYEDDSHHPLVIRGAVRTDDGAPAAGAVIDVWHSTPDGKYSGFHDQIPTDLYRGKVVADAQGKYAVRTTMPAPYQIPNKGPTGVLLEMMGSHTWRPAHVHFKVRKDGFVPLTTQYYFEGGDWVDSDCCKGVAPDLVMPAKTEGGAQVMAIDFVIERPREHA